MDAMTLTVVFKGVATLLLILGGIVQIRYGYKLYSDGVGSKKEESIFEFGSVKLMPKSVGSVVMGTAALWAFSSISMSPNYEHSPDMTKVFSFDEPEVEFSVAALYKKERFWNYKFNVNDKERLLSLYGEALREHDNNSNMNVSLKIADIPHSIKYGKANACYDLLARTSDICQEIKTPYGPAKISYVPEHERGEIRFVPKDIKLDIKDKDPENLEENKSNSHQTIDNDES